MAASGKAGNGKTREPCLLHFLVCDPDDADVPAPAMAAAQGHRILVVPALERAADLRLLHRHRACGKEIRSGFNSLVGS